MTEKSPWDISGPSQLGRELDIAARRGRPTERREDSRNIYRCNFVPPGQKPTPSKPQRVFGH